MTTHPIEMYLLISHIGKEYLAVTDMIDVATALADDLLKLGFYFDFFLYNSENDTYKLLKTYRPVFLDN